MEMSTGRSQRRWRTILISPGAQFRLSLHILIWAVFTVVALLIVSFAMDHVIAAAAERGHVPPSGRYLVETVSHSLILIASSAVIITGLFAFVYSIWQSHRIYGPLVPLNRMIERLEEGDFAARVHLRRADEFQELGAALNRLAERLAKDHGASDSAKERA